MAIIEDERRSARAPTETIGWTEEQWANRERELNDGGNGGGGGNFDDDDGDHLPDRPEGDGDISPETYAGFLGGMMAGLMVGIVATGTADDIMVGQYKKTHHIITKPTTIPAVEAGIYDRAINKNVELGTFAGPMLVLAAVGMVIGHKIHKYRNG
jgi:hypothetical protein